MKKISRRDFIALSATTVGMTVAGGAGQVMGETAQAASVRDGNQVSEAPRSIPVMAECDILVVGSGPAGLSASLASAREGTRTIIVERYGFFGGVITQVNMGSIAWYRYAHTVDAGGIMKEFESRAKKMGASVDPFAYLKKIPFTTGILEKEGLIVNGVPTYEVLDTEMFKYVADTMLLEAGIVPVLHCLAVGAVMDGDAITGIITESKSGRQAIMAKRVIDATGDADIAHFAGAPFRKSPKEELMEVTTNFGCTDVNLRLLMIDSLMHTGKMKDWAYETSGKEDEMASTALVEPFNKAKQAGEIPQDWFVESYWNGMRPSSEIQSMDAVHLRGVDVTDVWDLTRAEMEGRRRSIKAMEALRKYQPGFSKARIGNFGTSLGARESRKIIGAGIITEHDIKNQARFADSIGVCPEFIDGYNILYMPTTGRYFQVPYGIILPMKVENLLVAGRCVAGDRISHAATRQMVCCMVTGQGAGVAAALSLKDKVTCRQVSIASVQESLKKQGVRIL
jgi:ribulose 1,5-bisphosphate synthetase/thiazole synthase